MHTYGNNHLTTMKSAYLGKIASIVEEKDTSQIVIIGDINAAVNTPFEV